MIPCNYDDAIDWKHDLEDTFKEISSKRGYPYSTKYTALEENAPGTDTLRSILTNILPESLVYQTKEDAQNAKRKRAENEAEKKKGQTPKFDWSVYRTNRLIITPFLEGLAFFFSRFAIALISGAFLIVPMIIMTLNKSLNKSLITTSAAVMVLAGVLSFIIKAKTYDVITTTATYAAVLVVFVGLSS